MISKNFQKLETHEVAIFEVTLPLTRIVDFSPKIFLVTTHKNINKLLSDYIIMRNKRGQFYLLAAIIIVGLILGFAAVSNYAKKKESTRLFDLGDELGIESGEVLDFGTIREDVDNTVLLEHFTTLYDKYVGEDKKMYYIFGDKKKVVAYEYGKSSTGSIDVNIGGSPSGLDILRKTKIDLNQTIEEKVIEGNLITIVKVTIPDLGTYEFELKPGENFYFVISQEIGGERHVVTG